MSKIRSNESLEMRKSQKTEKLKTRYFLYVKALFSCLGPVNSLWPFDPLGLNYNELEKNVLS